MGIRDIPQIKIWMLMFIKQNSGSSRILYLLVFDKCLLYLVELVYWVVGFEVAGLL
jgi:hypothetical protein